MAITHGPIASQPGLGRHAHTNGLVFTKAALLTIGGAYAVLPYVYQGAVGTYGWLTPTQMIDGLALGETTPGPLIMVVAFVAFVGALANWYSAQRQLFIRRGGGNISDLVYFFTVFYFYFSRRAAGGIHPRGT